MQSFVRGAAELAGLASADDGGTSTKLETFLTTLVTYPYLYLAATTHVQAPGGATTSAGILAAVDEATRAATKGSAAHSVNEYAKASGPGPAAAQGHVAAVASDVRTRLTDFPEGRAITMLERWCSEPAVAGRVQDLGMRLREHLKGLSAWVGVQVQMLAPSTDARTGELVEEGMAGEASRQAVVWLGWVVGVILQGLDTYLGPAPPELSLPEVVGIQRLRLEQGLVNGAPSLGDREPISLCASAVGPNIQHVQHQLQQKYALSRSRTWLEYMNVLLGWVRLWLTGVAYGFYLMSTGLRILGNALTALGGLVAFTVVLSIAISVLSALVFLAASAADTTGALIEYAARFTDLAERKSRTAVRVQGVKGLTSKLGPKTLGPASIEELEDFWVTQLVTFMPPAPLAGPAAVAGGGPGPAGVSAPGGRRIPSLTDLRGGGGQGLPTGLRSRPDAPRLAHDPLLIRAYDLQIIDGMGNVNPHVFPEAVTTCFDPNGFFGLANEATRKAAAVLLLRLLAWRRIASMMSPSPSLLGGAPEAEEPLRYAWMAGIPGSGAATLFRALAGLPRDYQIAGATPHTSSRNKGVTSSPGCGVAEIRPVARHRHAYLVLPPRTSAPDSGAAATCPTWVADLSHGVVSCLLFVVSVDIEAEAAVRASIPLSAATSPRGSTSGHPQSAAGPQGRAQDMLRPVWQALALHRPVLVCINKASRRAKELAEAPGHASDAIMAAWRSALGEEASRRGLDVDPLSVTLTEVLGDLPPGAAGVAQVQDWLNAALGPAPLLR